MRLYLSLLAFLMVACGPNKSMVVNARDAAFYDRFVNSSQEATSIDAKLTSVKLIETGKEFPIRVVLFDNHTFYYQVDRLGTGTGKWTHEDGALEMIGVRPFFDLALYLSAAKSEGDEVVLRFVDRFGLNTIPASLRLPAKASEPLPEFTESEKGL